LYRELLREARFFELLLRIDQEIAQAVRARGCPKPGCGGPLRVGHFARKPRGLQEVPDWKPPKDFWLRFDWCCGCCRQRTLPESVRFLGRKVYLGVVVVIASVLARGPTRDALRLLQSHLQVSWNTLKRWCTWWLELPRSAFWQSIRGVLSVDLDLDRLPESLLACFVGASCEQVVRLLRLLGPLTARGFPSAQGDSR
jgi:hypothetical protein